MATRSRLRLTEKWLLLGNEELQEILKFLTKRDFQKASLVCRRWNDLWHTFPVASILLGFEVSPVYHCTLNKRINHLFVFHDVYLKRYFPDIQLESVFLFPLSDCFILKVNDIFCGYSFMFFDLKIQLVFLEHKITIQKKVYFFDFEKKFLRNRQRAGYLKNGDFFHFRTSDTEQFPKLNSKFGRNKSVNVFTLDVLRQLIESVGEAEMDNLTMFCTLLDARKRLIDDLVSGNDFDELPQLQKLSSAERIHRLIGSGLKMEMQIARQNELTFGCSGVEMQEILFSSGLHVFSHHQQHRSYVIQNKNRYPQFNSSLFIVDNPTPGIRDFAIDNSTIRNLEYSTEMQTFDALFCNVFPSKHLQSFIDSDSITSLNISYI